MRDVQVRSGPRLRPTVWPVLGLFAMSGGSAAHAGISEIVFDIEATSARGSGAYRVSRDAGTFDSVAGTFDWSQTGGVSIVDDLTGAVIATLLSANVYAVEDPQVYISFEVQAEDEDTDFTITSSLLSFSTISDAMALASAAVTLTDTNGNGASLTGLGPTGGASLAQYNGMVPSGTTFLEAIDSLTAEPGTSASASTALPEGGVFQQLLDPVSDISSQFHFTLSGSDLASGTSNFVVAVVPLPAALPLGLAALAGLVLARRRQGRAAPARPSEAGADNPRGRRPLPAELP